MTASTSIIQSQSWSTRWKSIKPWVVCLSAALFFLYDFIQMSMMNVVQESLRAEFSLSDGKISQLSASYTYATVLFLLPCGSLLDRFSTRTIILVSMALGVIGTALFAFAHNPHVLFASRMLTGATAAFCFLSCITLASRWLPSNKMGAMSSAIVTMAMLGGFFAQGPLESLVARFGWRDALMYDAVFGLVLWVYMFQVLKDTPTAKHFKPTPKAKEIGTFQAFRRASKIRQIWVCGTYTSLMNILIMVMGTTWGIPYLQNVHGLSHAQAANATGMIFLGTIIGGPLVGVWSDRIAKRRLPMQCGAVLSLFLSFLVILPNYSFAAPNTLSLIMCSLFFLMGLTSSTQIITYPAIMESTSPNIIGVSESISSVLVMGIGAISLPVFSWLNSHQLFWNQWMFSWTSVSSAFNQAYLLIPASFLVSCMLSFLVRETYCRPYQGS